LPYCHFFLFFLNFLLTTNCFCDINSWYNEEHTSGIEYNIGKQKGDAAECTEKFSY
jgi:hypothetical protein